MSFEDQNFVFVKIPNPFPHQQQSPTGPGAWPPQGGYGGYGFSPTREPERRRINEDLVKDLTLSPELLSQLPENILEWKPHHAVLWLEEIFAGAGDLAGYKEKFQAKGINGVDLLKMTNVSGYGIVDIAHVDRIESYLSDLASRQKRFVTEADYSELKKQHDLLKDRIPPYILPRKIMNWKPVDVMFFMLHDRNKDIASKFVKPLAMSKIDGPELLKRCRAPKFELKGLVAEETEIARFTEAVNKHDKNQIALEARQRKDRTTAFRTKIPVIPPAKVRQLKKLAAGSFGEVYLCEYEKRRVVTKELIDEGAQKNEAAKKMPSLGGNAAGKATNKGNKPASDNAETELSELEKAEAARADVLTEDLRYEADMLWRAAGLGIVQIIGVIESRESRPKIVTEYLSGNTVEQECTAARNGDSDSIFHDRYHGNLEKKKNNFKDPVLLQKVRIARDVAAALDRLHAKGIIHLDIAARNIFLDAGKRPKIGDFGLAAIESEMLEQYALRKRVLDEHSVDGFISSEEADLLFQMDVEARQATDENAMRKHNMQLGKRPIKWMPDWVIDCGDPPNPLIDRHADVYSFGCLMYEMAMFHPPHADISREEVEVLKRARRGTPTVPGNLDPRYARIMASCWDAYEHQPSMTVVANNLAELHRQLIAETYDGDAAYTEFKDYAEAVRVKSAASVVSSGVYSEVNAAEAKVQSDAQKIAAGPPGERPTLQSYPAMAGGRVRLRFPPSIDVNDVAQLYEFEDAGVSVEMLKSVLQCAYHFNDTLTIATYMQCICVEDSATQVSMLVECLKHIQLLAKDEHGSADDPETWHMLCSKVLAVAQTAVTFTSTSHVSVLEPRRLMSLLSSVLAALCALLDIKSFDLASVSEDKSIALVRDMTSVSVGALWHFANNEEVVDKAAVVVFYLAANPQRLHEEGVVQLLLNTLVLQKLGDSTVTSCIKALGSFPLPCLCQPVPRVNASPKAVVDAVYGEVFEAMIRMAERFYMNSNAPHLVICLEILFQVCESSVLEPECIESFLFTVTSANISMLFEVIKQYADNFKLQRSAIGLLAHIVQCGAGVRNADDSIEMPPLPARERLAAMLTCDPSFELLLAAMEKFVISDKASVSIADHPSGAAGLQENKISMGAASSYSTARGGQRDTAGTAHHFNATSQTAEASLDGDLLQLMSREIICGMLETLLYKDTMLQLTAASLQKSVAVIVGIGCNSSKDVQQKMVRSGFNEFILLAFKNYVNDVQLIEYGCHALFSTCRRNAMHQRMLHEAHVMNHLFVALRSHSQVWQIVDGVMCAILGLLEPEDPKTLTTLHRSKCDGLRVAQTITTDINFDGQSMTLIKWLALAVAEFQINGDCGQLVSNYMRLISMTLLWLPDMLGKWNTLFVDLRGSRTIRKYLQRAFREVGRGITIGGAGTRGADSNSGGTAEHAGKEKAAVAYNIYSSGCDFITFVLLSLQFQQGQSNVSGAGFCVLTSIYLHAVPAGLAFGKELPYSSKPNLRDIRTKLLDNGLLALCLSTLNGNKLGYHDPVLIRYTLWLFLLFISESREVVRDTGAFIQDSTGKEGSSIASKISIEKGIEWAIEVIRKFPTYYSLQCLATMFLLWMEQHGKFSNRSVAKLRDLQALLMAAREREMKFFLPLDQESYDTHLLNKSHEMFGELRTHADRLLTALAEVHLKSDQKSESVDRGGAAVLWDGRCSPHEVTVVAFQSAENPVTLKLSTVYVVNVQWDVCCSWRLMKSFASFFDLQTALSAELSHIDFNVAPLVAPKKAIKLWKKSNAEIEERRQMLNTWMTQIIQNRAVRFSNELHAFLNVSDNTITVRSATLEPPQACPAQQEFPITCVYYDEITEMIFVTSARAFVPFSTSMKVKACGAVSVFDSRATAVRGIPPLVQQQYSVGAVCVTYSADLHCVYVGLADGSVLFYHLVVGKPSTLTYVSEISCHAHPISAMVYNHVRQRMIAASTGGTMSVFDTNKGEILLQRVLTRAAFTSVAYYAELDWCFCGTSAGTIVVYDVSNNHASQQVWEFRVTPDLSDANGIHFEGEHHQLYVAASNQVVVYNVPFTAAALPQMVEWKRLTLAGTAKITSMTVLMGGQYIAVTCESVGAVTLFDMTSKDAPFVSKRSLSQKKPEADRLTTASDKVAPWKDVVTQSNATIRLWLQGHGLNSSGAANRAALLKMLKSCAKITSEQLAERLRVVNPYCDVLLSTAVMYGCGVTCSYYVPRTQHILVGGSSGRVASLCLTDFLPLPTVDDEQQVLMARSAIAPAVVGNTSAIKVNVGAVTRGKRLQVDAK